MTEDLGKEGFLEANRRKYLEAVEKEVSDYEKGLLELTPAASNIKYEFRTEGGSPVHNLTEAIAQAITHYKSCKRDEASFRSTGDDIIWERLLVEFAERVDERMLLARSYGVLKDTRIEQEKERIANENVSLKQDIADLKLEVKSMFKTCPRCGYELGTETSDVQGDSQES